MINITLRTHPVVELARFLMISSFFGVTQVHINFAHVTIISILPFIVFIDKNFGRIPKRQREHLLHLVHQ